MTVAQLYRLSGFALVIGAIVSIVTSIVSATVFPSNTDPTYAQNALFVPLALVSAAGAMLLLLGLPGWYARHAGAAGVTGFVGFVGIFITGLMFPVFFSLFAALIFPFIATEAPQLLSGQLPPGFFTYAIVGLLIQLIASIALAIPMLRGRILPRWLGYVLVLSAVLGVGSFLVGGPDTTPNALSAIVSTLSNVLVPAVLGVLGWRLLGRRDDTTVAERPATAVAR